MRQVSGRSEVLAIMRMLPRVQVESPKKVKPKRNAALDGVFVPPSNPGLSLGIPGKNIAYFLVPKNGGGEV